MVDRSDVPVPGITVYIMERPLPPAMLPLPLAPVVLLAPPEVDDPLAPDAVLPDPEPMVVSV